MQTLGSVVFYDETIQTVLKTCQIQIQIHKGFCWTLMIEILYNEILYASSQAHRWFL